MVSRGLMLKFAQIMEHLFYDGKKMEKITSEL